MAKQPFKLAAGTAQHIGDRTEQQDRVGIFTSRRMPGSALFVVADGMGGKTGGAMAAEQVMSTARNLYAEYSPVNETPRHLLSQIASESHTVIKLTAMSAEKEPHSTVIALLLQPTRADWMHVGDSRLYFYKGSEFQEHTVDHSYVQRLVAEGKLRQEDAKNHRQSNVLVYALGTPKPPVPSFGGIDDLNVDDCFLLCSDGLWHYFENDELGQILANETPRRASEVLIDQSRIRAQGRGDNCSLAIAKLEPLPEPPAHPMLRRS